MNNQEQLNEDLIRATKHGNLEQVKALIKKGAKINNKNGIALINAVKMGNLDIVKYLVENDAKINYKNIKNTPLKLSAENGYFEVVKYLVEHGADIHDQNDAPLRMSTSNGHLEVVKYLIIDCNMIVKEETLEYLHKNNLVDILNIIQTRDLHNQLDHNLNSKITDTKNKVKI
jgi:ankyrin repeat protein